MCMSCGVKKGSGKKTMGKPTQTVAKPYPSFIRQGASSFGTPKIKFGARGR